MSFYSNICKLLSTLHGGIKHQRPSVKLPLSKVRALHCSNLPLGSETTAYILACLKIVVTSKVCSGHLLLAVVSTQLRVAVLFMPCLESRLQQGRKLIHPQTAALLLMMTLQVGLELSRILTNLGIIEDFSIGQRLSRVRAHSRLWDPTRTSISSSADAAGYPAMYLTLHLNYDKYKPLWCRSPLAAAPHVPSLAVTSSSSISSSSTGSTLPDPQNFTPPMGVNSPTPETVKIISKPSVQRWMGVKELLHARVSSRPGIFLLSTHQVGDALGH